MDHEGFLPKKIKLGQMGSRRGHATNF